MKKKLVLFLGILSAFLFVACSGLDEKKGSVSVKFPKGTVEKLFAARAETDTATDAPASEVYDLPTATLQIHINGDYADRAVYENLDLSSIDEKEFVFDDIPEGSEITIEANLDINSSSVDIANSYYGKSSIKVKSGENVVSLLLKKKNYSVDIGISDIDLKLAFESKVSNMESYNVIDYSGDEKDYKIVLVVNGEIYKPEDAIITWKVNGDEITSDQNSGQCYISSDKLLNIPVSILNTGKTFVSCLIKSSDKVCSASNEFKVVISNPQINTAGIFTDYILHTKGDYYGEIYYSVVNELNSSIDIPTDGSKFYLKNGGGYYKENGETFLLEDDTGKSYGSIDGKDNFTAYLDGYFSYNNYEDYNIHVVKAGVDGFVPVDSISNELVSDMLYNFLLTYIKNDSISCYAVDNGDKILIYNREGLIKTIDPSLYFGTGKNLAAFNNLAINLKINDMMIIDHYLFALLSLNGGNSYNANAQLGGLLVVDLENLDIVKVYGETEKEYSVLTKTNNKITIFGNSDVNANSFFVPAKIIAIKEDDLYIAESGCIYSDYKDDSNNGEKKVQRISKVNLKNFAISCELDLSNTNFNFVGINAGSEFN